jgi:hypothetical protein
MKQYRIVEKIYQEGTKYEEKLWYPQVMDSMVLDDKIEPWQFFHKFDNNEYGVIWFLTKDEARKYIEKQKAKDIPVKTIIHQA